MRLPHLLSSYLHSLSSCICANAFLRCGSRWVCLRQEHPQIANHRLSDLPVHRAICIAELPGLAIFTRLRIHKQAPVHMNASGQRRGQHAATSRRKASHLMLCARLASPKATSTACHRSHSVFDSKVSKTPSASLAGVPPKRSGTRRSVACFHE